MDACEATKAIVAHYNAPMTRPTVDALQRRVHELESEARIAARVAEGWNDHCGRLERALAEVRREASALREALDLSSDTIQQLRAEMSDATQSGDAAAADKVGSGATDPIIDKAIDRLKERVVSPPDRGKLRDALDKADAPLAGRAASNEALGRITRR